MLSKKYSKLEKRKTESGARPSPVKAGAAGINPGAALNLHHDTGKEKAMRDYIYDRRMCVEAIRRFIEEHNSTDAKLYERLRLRPAMKTILVHVGSWNEAVRLAGGIPGKYRTSDEILESFRRTIATFGRLPTITEYMDQKLNPTVATLRRHGFSYEEAVRAIGLPYHYRKGPTHGKKICPMCGEAFQPNIGKQRYCSYACRDRFKAWKYRTLREIDRKCPQCGGEMDYPLSSHRNKKPPRYCSRCQSYYRIRHQIIKTPPG